jgi:stress-induced morphogen
MPLPASTIENLILEYFPDAKIKITDLAGDNDHWAVEVVSSAFHGKSRIEQHKMVYASLKGKMGGELHAMQLKTVSGN